MVIRPLFRLSSLPQLTVTLLKHAFMTIALMSAEGIVVGIFALGKSSLEDLAAKDPYHNLSHALTWIEQNELGSIAIVATLCAVQGLDFLFAWGVRMCCSVHSDAEQYEEGYVPLPGQDFDAQGNSSFRFSAYSPEALTIQQMYRGNNTNPKPSQAVNHFVQQPLLDGNVNAFKGHSSSKK